MAPVPNSITANPVKLPDEPVIERVIWDNSNPAAVVNVVTDAVKKAITDAIYTNPELFDKDEHTLWRHLRNTNHQTTAADNRMRLKFWFEYDRAATAGTNMNMKNVFAALCTHEFFYNKYIHNPAKIAWMLCPPTSYRIKVEEALEFGLEQLREILEAPHKTDGGKIDSRLAGIKLKIVQMLDTRAKGAIVQKAVIAQMGLPGHPAIEDRITQDTLAEMRKQLENLEKRNRTAQNLPLGPSSEKPVIEVDPE